ncbi:MAG: hypothetical protein E6I76_12175 [Chloroflexi bacterium]|nr:MAG: hypothetical protein E6I76_12175 [Chloroflexota bacterium]
MAGIGGGAVTGAAVGAGVGAGLAVVAGLVVGLGVALGLGVELDLGFGVGVGVCFECFFFFFLASGWASVLTSARQRACPGRATGQAGWKSSSVAGMETTAGEVATGAPQAPMPSANVNSARPTLSIRAPRIREPLPSPVVSL